MLVLFSFLYHQSASLSESLCSHLYRISSYSRGRGRWCRIVHCLVIIVVVVAVHHIQSVLIVGCHIVNRVVGRDAPPPGVLRMISLWSPVRTAPSIEARSLPVMLKSHCCWCHSGYAISFIAAQSDGPRSPCHSLTDCSYRLSAPTASYAGRCGHGIF